MLNISLPAGTKVELGPDSCIVVNGEKSRSDLDVGPTMPYIELVRDIFLNYNVFQFHVPRSITF